MRHTDEESLEGLPAQHAPGLVVDRDTEHQGHLDASLGLGAEEGVYAGLAVERVEDGLHQHRVDTAPEQGDKLLMIGIGELIKGDGTECGVVHIGAHGAGLVGGAHAGHHIAWPLWRGELIGHLACQVHGGLVDLPHQVLAMVVGHRDALAAEGVGADDISPGLQIAAMDVGYHIGACECEDIIVALHLPLEAGEEIATEVLLPEPVSLYHRAHGSVEDKHMARGDPVSDSLRGGECPGHVLPWSGTLGAGVLVHSVLVLSACNLARRFPWAGVHGLCGVWEGQQLFLNWRSISRLSCFSLSDSRLSYSFLPRAMCKSSLASPRPSMNSSVGMMLKPGFFTSCCILRISLRLSRSFRSRRSTWLLYDPWS